MARNYRELVAWQVAFDLARRVYVQTEKFPKDETFGLRAQIRRAATSVVSNVAEGAGRASKKDFAQFVVISRGSLNELETQYSLAVSLNYMKKDAALDEMIERTYELLNSLRNSLNAQRSTLNDGK